MNMIAVFLFLLFSSVLTVASLDTITPGQSITENETLVSAGGRFELGFYDNRYLAIWYKDASASSVVWLANRETPLTDNPPATLKITNQGLLILLNSKNIRIWSSNKTAKFRYPVMQLLDTGNLVVKDGNNSAHFFWQSFDSPFDTLLPGMRIGRDFLTGQDKFLTSWKNPKNPESGQFSLWINPRGFPQLVVRNKTSMHYRLGSWNGLRFTGTPQLPKGFLEYEFELNENGVYYGYGIQSNSTLMTRLVVNGSGYVKRFARTVTTIGWIEIYSAPVDECDKYQFCGPYMKCNIIDKSPICDCLEGFESNGSNGCARKVSLVCENDHVFINYKGFKLPDTSASWYNMTMSLIDCKELCSRNCSCTAYANSNISGNGSGCILWLGDLLDIREYPDGGQDMYIKISKQHQTVKKLIGIIVGFLIIMALLLAGIIVWIQKRRPIMKDGHIKDYGNKEGKEDMDLPIFDLATIVEATDNFSIYNKLGQGGFGPVYKGILTNGQEIAVKRLSKSSGQGLTEFKNEVLLISKLQHRNLVKLLGCCIQEDDKMLIYEFMPNKSLDHFIFDEMRSYFLDWPKRASIIGGIARGLLYLHQDSRLRIIHRDLKASNVLLDKDMTPKISDFGLARIFGGDQIEANTSRVAGTYGYMSPEYVVDGLFSLKSDVFSFGVLVLEIVSGKKNRGFIHPNHGHNLTGHAWKLWREEKAMELVDKMLECYDVSEVRRCIEVGLLCVQQRPDDRPSMSSVVVMLGSESLLPQPKQPGFYTERNLIEHDSSTSNHESSSVNQMSTTLLEGR